MTEFVRILRSLMDRGAKRRFLVAGLFMACISVAEGLVMLLMIPLMSMLTAPNLESTAPQVTILRRAVPDLTAGQLATALGISIVVLYLLKGVGAIFLSRWVTTLTLQEELKVVRRLLDGYLNAPYSVFVRENSATFVRTLNVSTRQVFGAVVPLFSSASDLLAASLVALVLVVTSPIPALATTAYFAVVAYAYQKFLQPRTARASARVHLDQAEDFRLVRQSLGAVKEIRVHRVDGYFVQEVHRLRSGLIPMYRTLLLNNVTPRYVLEMAMVGAAAAISLVAFMTQPLSLATATVVIFLVGAFRILVPLNKVIFGVMAGRTALPSARQIASDLDRFARPEPGDHDDQPPAEVDHSGTEVQFERVSFSYEPGHEVLHEVSFLVRPGEAIGLVGSSGAGKSTIADLLLGLLSPDSGRVRVSGIRPDRGDKAALGTVGYVPQVISLLDDTVVANIAFGVPPDQVDMLAVWKAIEQAQLREVILTLPEAERTRIGESGVRLSGGQRQRLGLARALYSKPSVLVLDEATSALDSETEARLSDILEGLHGEVTMVIIAHRLSTVRRCDRLLYLEEGTVVAEGTFEALADSVPGFARLVELGELKVGASSEIVR